MLQDEGDMRRPIQIGNDLHVIAKPIVGQLLVLRGRKSVWFDNSGRTVKLEVPFELQDEAVDLEERGLADGTLQFRQALQVMRIVPINMPQVKVGPICDAALRQV